MVEAGGGVGRAGCPGGGGGGGAAANKRQALPAFPTRRGPCPPHLGWQPVHGMCMCAMRASSTGEVRTRTHAEPPPPRGNYTPYRRLHGCAPCPFPCPCLCPNTMQGNQVLVPGGQWRASDSGAMMQALPPPPQPQAAGQPQLKQQQLDKDRGVEGKAAERVLPSLA